VRTRTDRRLLGWLREALPPLLFLGLIAFIWSLEAARRTPFILPSPLEVLLAGWETRVLLAGHIAVTMTEAALGLGIGLVLAVMAAAAMDLSGFIRRALYPVLVASQTIQVLAIAPLLSSGSSLG
jgi:putative hydroxymethylpyrimidine transport system permease protein